MDITELHVFEEEGVGVRGFLAENASYAVDMNVLTRTVRVRICGVFRRFCDAF